ncbi:MAG: hypothetical protein ABJE95_12155 [Byssovorax sp.]
MKKAATDRGALRPARAEQLMDAIAAADDARRLDHLGERSALLFEERAPAEPSERDEITRIEDVSHDEVRAPEQ